MTLNARWLVLTIIGTALFAGGGVKFIEETEPEDGAYIVGDLIDYTASWTGPDDAPVISWSWSVSGDGKTVGFTNKEDVAIFIDSADRGEKTVTATCDTEWEIENEDGETEVIAGDPPATGDLTEMVNETWFTTTGDLEIAQESGSQSVSISAQTTAGDIVWEFPHLPGEVAVTTQGDTATLSIRAGLGKVSPAAQLITVIARSSEIERSEVYGYVDAYYWIRGGTRSTEGDAVSVNGEGSHADNYVMRYDPGSGDRYSGRYAFTADGNGSGEVGASVEPLKDTVAGDSEATAIAAVKIVIGDQEETAKAFAAGIITDRTDVSFSLSAELKKVGFSFSLSKTVGKAQLDSDAATTALTHRLREAGAHAPGVSIDVSSPIRVIVAFQEQFSDEDWEVATSGSGTAAYTLVEQDLIPAY